MSAELLAIQPNTDSNRVAIGNNDCACVEVGSCIAPLIAAAAGWRRAAALRDFALAGVARCAALDDDACAGGGAADAAARAATRSL